MEFILPITKFLFFPSKSFIYTVRRNHTGMTLNSKFLYWLNFVFIYLLWLVIQGVPQCIRVRPLECGLPITEIQPEPWVFHALPTHALDSSKLFLHKCSKMFFQRSPCFLIFWLIILTLNHLAIFPNILNSGFFFLPYIVTGTSSSPPIILC